MLFLDTETYSETPIKDGTYRYLEDAEVMIVTYAFDDGPVQCWDVTASQLMPNDLSDYLDGEGLISCHNSVFDRNVLKYCLGYDLPVERFRCTMVKAYLHGLPGKLDLLSDIFKLSTDAKDKRGKALIHLFCKPRKFSHDIDRDDYPDAKSHKAAIAAAKAKWVGRATSKTHPKEWQEFIVYAKSDITSLRRLDHLIPKWNITRTELAYWHLDQRRNDRGVAIDIDLAEAALRAVDKEQRTLKEATQELTGFDGEGEGLESTSKRDRMLQYMLEAYGVTLPDLKMDTILRRLDDPDLPIELKELLQIRLQVSTTSTSKYKSMLKAVNDDGRVRGLIQFAGAYRTGRDAGRTVQPQNFPSRDLMDIEDIEQGIKLLKLDAADLMYDNIMRLTSSCLRQTLVAGPGKKIIAADLSNIEGRYLAWAAGEDWKIQAFRDFDEGVGPDLYILAYARAFNMDPADVTKKLRQIGKVMELGLGYEGGTGAFLTFAAAYGLDLDELTRIAYDTLSQDIRKEAEGFYNWTVKMKRSTFGLSKEVFITCDSFKRMWREAHPKTVALWRGLGDGCRDAIQNPGDIIVYGKFKMQRTGQWLRLLMPSGRALCYPYPKVDDQGGISFMGSNIYTRKWERTKTHGGKLAENVTQAGARDVFKHGELEASKDGYDTIFPVHDELVTETPNTPEYNVAGLVKAMTIVPPWAKGLPLAADGFEALRYRK
jgi:DNA polymerase bacteriophage-type